MKFVTKTLAVVAVLAAATIAQRADAAIITFGADNVPGVFGTVSIDDSLFDGSSSQWVSNTNITGLSMTVFGEVFTFADVETVPDSTIIDSSGADPIIVNGAGYLAINGNGFQIAFFPDGFGGTAFDGDASLAFGTNVFGDQGVDVEFYAVQWNIVPEPGTLTIFGVLGLAGLGIRRRQSR